MRKIIYLTLLIIFCISCDKNETIQEHVSEKYQKTLDTLINYDTYLIGEFNGEVLASINQRTSWVISRYDNLDSVRARTGITYIILNNEISKKIFFGFTIFESKNLFEEDGARFKNSSDFYTFFNRSELEYFSPDNYKSLKPEISISYSDYWITDNSDYYYSSDFGIPPFIENNFFIESIREIEKPLGGIEIIFSFDSLLFSDSNKKMEIKNGKGKCFIED